MVDDESPRPNVMPWPPHVAPNAVWFVTNRRGVIDQASAEAAVFLGMRLVALQRKPLIRFVARQDTDAFRVALYGFEVGVDAELAVRLRPRKGLAKPIATRVRAQVFEECILWNVGPALGESPR
jgi:hypothetical protein